jgi:hypothetical protein
MLSLAFHYFAGSHMYPILLAIEEEDINILKLLIQSNCNTDCVYSQGKNILHFATTKGKFQSVHTVLQNSRKSYKLINQSDADNKLTPMGLAWNEANADILMLFVVYGGKATRVMKNWIMNMAFINGIKDNASIQLSMLFG